MRSRTSKPSDIEVKGIHIKTHPILFNTKMVEAILKGQKTETRRTIKDIHPDSELLGRMIIGHAFVEPDQLKVPPREKHASFYDNSPYGKKGDILWVKETWMDAPNPELMGKMPFYYRAGISKKFLEEGNTAWKPSLYMPRKVARIYLMITDEYPEKLCNITEEGAIAEGCIQYSAIDEWLTAKQGFYELWEEINGQGAYEKNPWVWVVKFKVISTYGLPAESTIIYNYLQTLGA